jgi:hypothetical protein
MSDNIKAFADYWGMDPDIVADVYGHMWDDYTLEGLPVLRERWADTFALCESEEERESLKNSIGYQMWQVLEILAPLEAKAKEILEGSGA